jgi:hypothetical protein
MQIKEEGPRLIQNAYTCFLSEGKIGWNKRDGRAYLDERFSSRELTGSEKVQSDRPVQSLGCLGGGKQRAESWQGSWEFLCGVESAVPTQPEDIQEPHLVQSFAVARDGVMDFLLPIVQILLQILNLRCESLESLGRHIP